ncbi:Ppx/GppA family phosphatase [Conexibacter sp. DBS9H8]|uniref:Ppx/GppA phosphatase family protein n=1 Tax=Conexibacter sp. DBS9H8 TaxID=2937801 RepID=UPI0020102257|nr:Ppx/GppA family phosphatase [Conexibacter sp. DBS9H8]
MRVAVIDIGTNTTRLFVADLDGRHISAELTRISRVTRLGAGVDADAILSPAALAREFTVLDAYAGEIAELAVDRTVAVMTSAVRDAANGPAFAAEVHARYGIDAQILTGEQEAALTYRGATDTVAPDSGERILVVDIGGGSTELVLGHGRTAEFHVSAQAGVVRQADRHLHGAEATAAELAALRADVAATLAAGVPLSLRSGVQRTLAVAGTPTSLAAIDLALDPYDPTRTHGYRLSLERVQSLEARLLALSADERRNLPGLHPDRAGVIVPGTAILLAVMDLFGLDAIEVSEHDILRGTALWLSSGEPLVAR